MFNFPGFPDMTKLVPMLEEALATFKQFSADVAEMKTQQAEILQRLRDLENK